MTGFINSHGTNPNLFSSEFMDLESVLYLDDDPDLAQPNSGWFSVEEFSNELRLDYEANDDVRDRYYRNDGSESTFELLEWSFDSYSSNRPTDKYDVLAKRHNIPNFSRDDVHWEDYYSEFAWDAGGDYDSRFEAGDDGHFGGDVETIDGPTPRFGGSNHTNRGAHSLRAISDRQNMRWMNNRRGTGLSRAPLWQKEAGGRKKGLLSIRTLPVPAEQTDP